jgi:uncharacterized protein (TIGR03083 family)
MATDASPWVKALRRSQDRVAALAAGLDSAGLRRGSYDTEWSMAQVLSHLGSQAEIFTLILEAGLTGGDAPAQDQFPPIWDAWNARSPEDQATDSVDRNERLVGRLEAFDDAQLESFQVAAFGMELTAPLFLRLRLSEHAIHAWDLAVILDPAATIDADAVALLIDRVPEVASRVGKPTQRRSTLKVVTRNPERSFALVTDGVALEPWSERDVDGELELSAEEMIRLVYGRLDPDHVSSVRLDSAALSLDDLRAVFPGI